MNIGIWGIMLNYTHKYKLLLSKGWGYKDVNLINENVNVSLPMANSFSLNWNKIYPISLKSQIFRELFLATLALCLLTGGPKSMLSCLETITIVKTALQINLQWTEKERRGLTIFTKSLALNLKM